MKKVLHFVWLVVFLLLPLKAVAQEDTCYVPDLFGTNQFLNTIIANDTAGTGWKGAGGVTAWENHTRVYVLQKNGSYPWNATIQLRTNRKLVIRAENGNYTPGGDWKPVIYGYPVASAYPGRFINLNQLNDTLILKNLSICGIDESTPGGLDKVQGNMIEIQSTGSGSIFIDSCVLKTINGQLMQIGASGACHANTIRVTNTILADMGFLGMSNLGAGRGIDFRNSEIDSVDINNCTFVNFQDRIVRHLLSLQPIHSFKFNHNTVLNGMSYCGTISLGWVDSLGNGPFEIKNNLFVDNFAMGPDTDLVRQSEFTDNPETDPRNGYSKLTWIVSRPNTTAHVTPWVIRNNYYCISDSGKAMRNLTAPYLHVPNQDPVEPILTADMKRQLQANGGDTLTAFRLVKIQPMNIPPLMTKLIRWYYAPESDGSPADYTNTGAGAGRKKTGSSGTPATHFIHDVTNNVWVYDFNRRTTGWYYDSLDAGYKADVDMSTAATDGKVIGSTMWSFKGVLPSDQPVVAEDTCYVPDLFGKNQYLNAIIAADTAGNGWKGASGATAWQNHTRVYVLQKNGSYPWNAAVQLRTNRKLVIRAEKGNYVPGGDWKPSIYGYPVAGAYPGRFINLNQLNDTLILKNVSICGIDESTLGGLDKVQGNMIEIQSTGSGSIFIDSCVLKTINGQLMQIGASGACHANTIKITNTILADMGFLGMSNLGAGRGIDFRNSEIDNVEISNCTFVNFQDRIVRHLLSLQPIHSFKFNHNTVLNGMSYCGTISLGWVDSLGSGPFEIKDNLFVDNFAMGPDTDLVRQSEFTDNPENDPRNGKSLITWIVARPNTTAHVTPWVISNNYYCISDSGQAMRQLSAPYLYVPNPNTVEPIMTADMKRQLKANGGDTVNAFRQVRIAPAKIPPLMTKMIRWYYAPESDGSPADYTNTGAGAGRKKTGSSGTPASHFIHDVTNNVWVYDFNRRTTGWYYDSLDAGYRSTADLSTAASDGQIVGSTMWTFKGIIESVGKYNELPMTYSLEQNYPNPFNPSTKIVYTVPRQSIVRLEVFDILGRKLATLVDQLVQAGKYEIEFDASTLGSGVYIYRLTTPATTISKKMLMLK